MIFFESVAGRPAGSEVCNTVLSKVQCPCAWIAAIVWRNGVRPRQKQQCCPYIWPVIFLPLLPLGPGVPDWANVTGDKCVSRPHARATPARPRRRTARLRRRTPAGFLSSSRHRGLAVVWVRRGRQRRLLSGRKHCATNVAVRFAAISRSEWPVRNAIIASCVSTFKHPSLSAVASLRAQMPPRSRSSCGGGSMFPFVLVQSARCQAENCTAPPTRTPDF